MNNYDETTQAPDARDFLGNYLKKEDLDEPALVTLIDVRPEQVPGNTRAKLVAFFEEFEKGLILNATNIRSLAKYYGTSNTAHWRGSLRLYVDLSVQFAGKAVGGIRIQHPDVENRVTNGSREDDSMSF